ncbi:MAG: hypothetical protein BGO09_05605 [Bacteroidetes bacterium 47-18]|nr:MAG: hypothetical protein BGO09_05605 [Bacteroidetes bacterium 47-18]
MQESMTTQLILANSLTEDKGLEKGKKYLFSLQASPEGVLRIVTINDIELYYPGIHDFLVSWNSITSLGWANDKETFAAMLQELKEKLAME